LNDGAGVLVDILFNISSSLFLLIGSFLFISGGVGILRFPDFYTRMHAVGVTDTLATTMILIGLMLQIPDTLVVLKLIVILLLTLFIGPTASHALAKAAIQNNLKPKLDQPKNSEKVASSKP